MSRRLLLVLLSACCCMASITRSAQGQVQAAARTQAITLEITIVELAGVQPDRIEEIERGGEEWRRLMSESKATILARLHLRTRLGEDFSAKIGQQSPIQTALLQTPDQARRNTSEQMPATVGFPQMTWENTGLNVEGKAASGDDGKLDIRLKIDMSALDHSTGRLTPTIVRRTLSEIVRMKEGETAMVMGLILQETPWFSPTGAATGPAGLSSSSLVVLLTAKPVH